MMVYICTKFHENLLNGDRGMERTQKVNGRTDERTDGQTGRRTDRQTNRRTDGRTARHNTTRLRRAYKNRMATRVITLWRVDVMSLTTCVSFRNNDHFEGDKIPI